MPMNEKAWCIKHGKQQTEEGHKRDKKERPHFAITRKPRINKKKGKLEMSKKGNKQYDTWRVC